MKVALILLLLGLASCDSAGSRISSIITIPARAVISNVQAEAIDCSIPSVKKYEENGTTLLCGDGYAIKDKGCYPDPCYTGKL